jgi:hypothetical protein
MLLTIWCKLGFSRCHRHKMIYSKTADIHGVQDKNLLAAEIPSKKYIRSPAAPNQMKTQRAIRRSRPKS